MNFPQCVVCKNIINIEARKCRAFPDGIPSRLWFGEILHNKSMMNDEGVIFEPMDEIKAK